MNVQSEVIQEEMIENSDQEIQDNFGKLDIHNGDDAVVRTDKVEGPRLDGSGEAIQTGGPVDISQQNAMELVVQNLHKDHLRNFQDRTGNFLPITEWGGLKLNEQGEVKTVKWESFRKGFLALQSLPSSVEMLKLKGCSGSLFVKLHQLPVNLRVLEITHASVSGVLSVNFLPRSLEFIDLSCNCLSGKLYLSWLPPNLREFRISKNCFNGGLVFDSLPRSLRVLWLDNNRFDGDICLRSLPNSLESLRINNNELCGNAILDVLPESLHELCLERNTFKGYSLDGKLPRALRKISIDKLVIYSMEKKKQIVIHGRKAPSAELLDMIPWEYIDNEN